MGAPASQVQCMIRQCRTECEHTKERWMASTECLFSFYAKWMDGRVEGIFFLPLLSMRGVFQIVCLDVSLVNWPK